MRRHAPLRAGAAAVLLVEVGPLRPTAPPVAAVGRFPVGRASTGSGATGVAGGRTWTVDTRAERKGSWCNGRPARLNAVTDRLGLGNDVGWDLADVYDPRVLTSAAAIERCVLRHAGSGRPHGRP
ncbi:hypothetical protein [Streptomyces sp. NPDC088801]|uniref:hypothetical protein n=1 Tax=Streptomyces sp. NPDC088801 TaxID=3365903 RepID=UPI00380671E1